MSVRIGTRVKNEASEVSNEGREDVASAASKGRPQQQAEGET